MTRERTARSRDIVGGHQPAGTDWPTLLVRSFLAVLPGQLVGFLIGGAIVAGFATLDMWPGWTRVVDVLAGLTAGLALGLVLRPNRAQRPLFLAVSAAFGVVVLSLLLALSRQRMPIPYEIVWSQLLLGLVLTVGVQTLVAWLLWRMRDRDR